MALTKITTVRDRLSRVKSLGLDEINFGVISETGLEHDAVYEEVLTMLDDMKAQLRSAYSAAKEATSLDARDTAWAILMKQFDGDIAKVLAQVGLSTDFSVLPTDAPRPVATQPKSDDGDDKSSVTSSNGDGSDMSDDDLETEIARLEADSAGEYGSNY